MLSLAQLWLPIVVSAVLIFVASSVIHMLLKYHNSEYRKLPDEEAARAVLRSAAPGQYVIPYVADFKEIQNPEMVAKFREGPIAFITAKPACEPTMKAALIQWFVLDLVVVTLVAYLASRTLAPGASGLAICREAGLVTFLAYGTGSVMNAIWMGKPWSACAKEVFDALVYAVVTALTFAWLWPH
jgi:hypothetical protein